jgi:hypothetical protein
MRYGISSKIASAWRKPGSTIGFGAIKSICLKRNPFLTFKNGSTCPTQKRLGLTTVGASEVFTAAWGRHGPWWGAMRDDGGANYGELGIVLQHKTCWSSISPTEMGRFVKQNVTVGDGEKAHGIHCRKPLKECSGLHSI